MRYCTAVTELQMRLLHCPWLWGNNPPKEDPHCLTQKQEPLYAPAAWLLHKSESCTKNGKVPFSLWKCVLLLYSFQSVKEPINVRWTHLWVCLFSADHVKQRQKTNLPPTHTINSSEGHTLKHGKFPLSGLPIKEENHHRVLPLKLDSLSLEVNRIFSTIFSVFELVPIPYKGNRYLLPPDSSIWRVYQTLLLWCLQS